MVRELPTAAEEREAVEMIIWVNGKDRGICMSLNLRQMRMLRMSNDSHTGIQYAPGIETYLQLAYFATATYGSRLRCIHEG